MFRQNSGHLQGVHINYICINTAMCSSENSVSGFEASNNIKTYF
jgi:hypothetical protein